MTFWITTSAMALISAATLALVLLRKHPAEEPAAAYDLRVYRDQLKDVDRDLERGVIGDADAARIRTEVSRRILTADAQVRAEQSRQGQSSPLTLIIAVLIGVGMIGGSLMLYRTLGAPGYGDLGLADRIEMAEQIRTSRPGQAEAEAGLPPMPPLEGLSPDYLQLVERLRETVASRPDDVQGQLLLARNEAASGNFIAAYSAQAEVLRLKGADAAAGDFADYADMLILAAGGYVSPEAESGLREALRRDPENGPARYYWGLMMAQTGRPDVAFRVWNTLLRQGPPDAPWIAPIRAQIEEMAQRAGVEFDLPPVGGAAPGPSAADVAAAGEMSETDRTQMIRSMVQRLSDRLATDGGTPAEWARLIGALSVLGDTDQAKAILENAKQVFAGDTGAMQIINDAAGQAGLTP